MARSNAHTVPLAAIRSMAFTSIVSASQESHRQAGNHHRSLSPRGDVVADVVADVDGGPVAEAGVDDAKMTPQIVGTGVPVPH